MEIGCYNMVTKEVTVLFIKSTKVKGYEYLKLVESYRENGVAKHRILFNIGRVDLLKQNESFLLSVKKLCELTGIPVGNNETGKKAAQEESEAAVYNYGYIAYKKLWEETGIGEILESLQNGCAKTEYSIPETAFLMAVQHLLEPRSKLATYERQNRYFNMNEIALHHMYRTLDKLSEWKTDIEWELFEYNYVRAKKTVDVVFYDVTTVSFESVNADALREFGYSKNCKFNEVQVVMGMIIDINGMPVGYELFQGNTFDGKTMTKALENIRKRFGIKRVIIVADRGINSKDNLGMIKESGYGYIMAGKIRGMSRAMKNKMLSGDGYIIVNDDKNNEIFKYKEIPYINKYTDANGEKRELEENLIVSYSQNRASKDRKDRERLIEKAKKLLEHPEKIDASNKRGGKKYIGRTNPEKTGTWELLADKIEKDAEFDGYYGIQTSEKEMAATEVMEAYNTLWKIEESFRILKSTLEIGPVYHWSPERVRGHFVLCFLAFLLERKMEIMLKDEKDGTAASPGKIQEALNTMQLASVQINGEDTYFKVKCDPLCTKIFKLLKINMPMNINKKDELAELFNMGDKPDYIQLSLI